VWPNSRTHAEKVFADVPTEDVRRIVRDNARELFRFPADRAGLAGQAAIPPQTSNQNSSPVGHG
jgi:hypothetical protein